MYSGKLGFDGNWVIKKMFLTNIILNENLFTQIFLNYLIIKTLNFYIKFIWRNHIDQICRYKKNHVYTLQNSLSFNWLCINFVLRKKPEYSSICFFTLSISPTAYKYNKKLPCFSKRISRAIFQFRRAQTTIYGQSITTVCVCV